MPVNPSLQALFIFLFRNLVYDLTTFAVTIAIAFCLFAEGSLCMPVMNQKECLIDPLLSQIVQFSNFYFLLDFVIQMICDGSVSEHFRSGENIFNFLVNIFTTLSALLPIMGVDPVLGVVPFFRSLAILRLLRGCKYFFLKPIWLMLIKFCGALISMINLIVFHAVFTCIYFTFGRFLFLDSLNGWPPLQYNPSGSAYNFSSFFYGWMTLFTVMTGDGWTSIMYDSMLKSCTVVEGMDMDCSNPRVVLAALYFIIYFFYGQYIFITMFLAIVLDAFAVEEFMEQAKREDDDKMLSREDAQKVVADFQRLPVSHVSENLMNIAWQKLCDPGKSAISRNALMVLVRMVQPMNKWRLAKELGLVKMRQVARQTILLPLYISGLCGMDQLLKPYPGDEDYVEKKIEVVKMSLQQAEVIISRQMGGDIRAYMKRLQDTGMMGEVMSVASGLGVMVSLDMKDLSKTEPLVGLKLLRHPYLAKRIGISGVFDIVIAEVLRGERPVLKPPEGIQEERDNALESLLDGKKDMRSKQNETIYMLKQKFHVGCWFLVRNPAFDALTFATIITSSVFLCLEPPHKSMPSYLSYATLRLWDNVFNAIFITEAVAKIGAFGLYTPRHLEYVAYLQVSFTYVLLCSTQTKLIRMCVLYIFNINISNLCALTLTSLTRPCGQRKCANAHTEAGKASCSNHMWRDLEPGSLCFKWTIFYISN